MFTLACIGWPASRGLCRSRACRVSGSRTPSMTRGQDVLACGSCVDRPGSMAAGTRGGAGHWDGYGILTAAAEAFGTLVLLIAVKTRGLEAGCIRLFILVIVAPLLLLLLWLVSLSLPFLSAPVSDSLSSETDDGDDNRSKTRETAKVRIKGSTQAAIRQGRRTFGVKRDVTENSQRTRRIISLLPLTQEGPDLFPLLVVNTTLLWKERQTDLQRIGMCKFCFTLFCFTSPCIVLLHVGHIQPPLCSVKCREYCIHPRLHTLQAVSAITCWPNQNEKSRDWTVQGTILDYCGGTVSQGHILFCTACSAKYINCHTKGGLIVKPGVIWNPRLSLYRVPSSRHCGPASKKRP
ncbi:hypothetical protein V8C44DRAFT_227219 [Trichoderma aethiopicum]